MNDGEKILLEFEATGADKAVEEIKKVSQAEKDLSLQEQANERTKGRSFSLASDMPETAEEATARAEREARQMAARLSNEKAVAEAQAVRIERAQVANFAQAEADLAQLIAAREKLALEEKQSLTVLQRAASRAILPESRINEAGRMLLRNEGAMSKLATTAAGVAPIIMPIAIAGGLAGVAMHEASKGADELAESAKQAGIDVTGLERASHPVKAAMGDLWEGTKSLASGLANLATGGQLEATKSAAAEAKAHVEAAIAMKEQLEAAKKLHEEEKSAAADYAAKRGYALEATDLERKAQALRDNLELASAQAVLQGHRAERTGQQPEGDKVVADFDLQAQKFATGVQLAELALEKAVAKLRIAEDNAQKPGTIAQKEQAQLAERAAHDAVELAKQALETIKQKTAIEVTDAMEIAGNGIKQGVISTEKKVADGIIEQINKVKTAQGGLITAEQNQVLQGIEELQKHFTGTSSEQKKLIDLLVQLRNATATSGQETRSVVQELLDLMLRGTSIMSDQKRQMEAIKAKQEQIMYLLL